MVSGGTVTASLMTELRTIPCTQLAASAPRLLLTTLARFSSCLRNLSWVSPWRYSCVVDTLLWSRLPIYEKLATAGC